MNKTAFAVRKVLLASLIGSTVPAPSYAAVDVFLKIDGIDGEATTRDHKGEITVYAYSWGMDRAYAQAAGGASAAGRPCVSELTISKPLDKASPKLMGAVIAGNNIGKARMTMRFAGEAQQDFYLVEMTNVQVSSLQQSGSSELPMEQVSLRFQSVNVSYKPQDDKGGLGPTVPVSIRAGTC